MQYLRIYAGPDGESHFEDVDVAMTANDVSHTSDLMTAKGVIFHRSPGNRTHDWHNAPRRQFVVHLIPVPVDAGILGVPSVRR